MSEEIAIVLDAVGVVGVVAEEKAQIVRLARLDYAFQLAGRVGVVAGKHDLSDREFAAFPDFEHKVNAFAIGRDCLWLDPHLEVAALTVKLDNAFDIVVHDGPRQRSALLRLHDVSQVVVLDLLVALEHQFHDGRIFHDGDTDMITIPRNLHVLKKPGAVKAFQRAIDCCGIKPPVTGCVKMRPDQRGIDVPIAVDRNRRINRSRRFHARASRKCENTEKTNTANRGYDPATHQRRSAIERPAHHSSRRRRKRDRLCRNVRIYYVKSRHND